jgi:cytochrome c oxidase assembly factor CtaG
LTAAPTGGAGDQVAAERAVHAGARRARPALLSAGALILAAVLASSLSTLRSLFTAFAIEHLLLTLVAPLLVVAGLPSAVPAAPRATAHGRPWRAFALFHVTVAVALLPPVLDTAHTNPPLWLLHRLVIFAAALIFWRAIAAPDGDPGKLEPPMQVLYAFLATIPTSLMAVILARAPNPLYVGFTAGPARLGATQHQDQMLGALVMWIPALFFYFGVISFAFWRWQRDDG